MRFEFLFYRKIMLSKISKNFLLISLLFILAWLGMVLFRFNSDNGALEKQLLSHLEKAAEGKATEISAYLDERKNDMAFLASLPNVREGLKKKTLSDRTKETLDFFQKSNGYLDLILIDMEGKVLWTADNKELLGADLTSADQEKTKLGEVYKKVKKDFGVGIFDPGYYGRDDKISIFITMPVLVDSLPAGEAGETPWQLVGPVLSGEKPIQQPTLPAGTYPKWSGKTVYDGGDRVLFEGIPFQAKW